MDYTREEAAQLARLHKAMSAPACGSCRQGACVTPEACKMPVKFAGEEPSEFLAFMADMAAAGKTLLIWLVVVLACLFAAVAVTLGV